MQYAVSECFISLLTFEVTSHGSKLENHVCILLRLTNCTVWTHRQSMQRHACNSNTEQVVLMWCYNRSEGEIKIILQYVYCMSTNHNLIQYGMHQHHNFRMGRFFKSFQIVDHSVQQSALKFLYTTCVSGKKKGARTLLSGNCPLPSLWNYH